MIELLSNKIDYLKCTSKSSHMSQKVFDKNLIVIRKDKVSLNVNKTAYIRMGILELSKVLMYELW